MNKITEKKYDIVKESGIHTIIYDSKMNCLFNCDSKDKKYLRSKTRLKDNEQKRFSNSVIKNKDGYYLKIQSYTYGEFLFRIDANDIDKVTKYNWSISKRRNDNIYAYCNSKDHPQQRLLHRFICGCDNDDYIEHINGDIFDNRKENLKVIPSKDSKMNNLKKAKEGNI